MTIKIYTALTLSQMQTILAFILSVLGFGWFLFLSNFVKFRALKLLKDNGEVPILETIVPVTITDIVKIVNILRRKLITPAVATTAMVVIGLVLTSFEGIIVLQTIDYVESCDTTIVKTQAKITNEVHRAAAGASAEIDAMMKKRIKSGVPSGILVGQIPEDNRWKYDFHLDVDPYPWRSSCSLYNSGTTRVNMNTSIFTLVPGPRETLPELHAEYIFRNSPDGYNYTGGGYEVYVYYNTTNGTNQANGALILLIEGFTRGDFYTIGSKYINRLWTMKVIIPYDPDNLEMNEIVSVPIAVKAYTCEMERVKEGDYGSYNVRNQIISAFVGSVSELVGRKWILAVISGKNTSFELTPEHWTSYLAVKDMKTAEVAEVLVRINISCITVHSAYTLLVCVYVLMTIIGMCLLIIRWRKHKEHDKIPSNVIEWARLACKESKASVNTEHGMSGYSWGVASDNILKIKLVKNLNIKESSENILKIKLIKNLDVIESRASNSNTGHGLFDYNFGVTPDKILKIKLADAEE